MSQNIPEITESTKFNLITSIWIVPIIALIIAGWLAYQHFSDRGPEIRIIFPKNEGLIAGQSVVKFRNVPVGKVTKIYVEETEDAIQLVFENKGKPMSEEVKSRIFHKFNTFGKKQGTGLGTYGVKLITLAHKGKVSFESKDELTRFILTYPKYKKI